MQTLLVLQLKISAERHFGTCTYTLEALMWVKLNVSSLLYLSQLRFLSSSFFYHSKSSLNNIKHPPLAPNCSLCSDWQCFLISYPISTPLLQGLPFAFWVKNFFLVLDCAETVPCTSFYAVEHLASLNLAHLWTCA